MRGNVRVVLHRAEIRQLSHNHWVQDRLESESGKIANLAADLAPKDTGGGAASIHEVGPFDDGSFRVSWDDEHYYMKFQEFGTEKMPAHPFLRPAGDFYSR
jgi:HK97 gp10 family phage protein